MSFCKEREREAAAAGVFASCCADSHENAAGILFEDFGVDLQNGIADKILK